MSRRAGGIARGLKRKAAEAQSGGGGEVAGGPEAREKKNKRGKKAGRLKGLTGQHKTAARSTHTE